MDTTLIKLDILPMHSTFVSHLATYLLVASLLCKMVYYPSKAIFNLHTWTSLWPSAGHPAFTSHLCIRPTCRFLTTSEGLLPKQYHLSSPHVNTALTEYWASNPSILFICCFSTRETSLMEWLDPFRSCNGARAVSINHTFLWDKSPSQGKQSWYPTFAPPVSWHDTM